MGHVSLDDNGDGVVVLTADRPPANAMDVTLLGDILEAVEQLVSDLPRALVLAGRPGFFSAGADLKAVPSYDPEDQRRMVTSINEMALGIYELASARSSEPSPAMRSPAGSCSRCAPTSASRPARAATG